MNVIFVHRNYPAQFGHIAQYLQRAHGWHCTFVTEKTNTPADGIQKIIYTPGGGATERTHYCARTFENGIWHAAAVYQALKPHAAALHPNLIVGHSGFGSTAFLPELFPNTPIINYFEYYYHAHNSDLDFRPEWQPHEYDYLRARARNAMILLDLQTCTAGYSPTHWQRSRFPNEYQPKIRVLHDGIDTDFWKPNPIGTPRPPIKSLPPQAPVVTYVARGLESMRGFDIFLQVAKRIHASRPDVHFLIIGSDRVAYGGDLKHIGAFKTFKEYALAQDDYPLNNLHFLGHIPPRELAQILAASDLHIYLTVPFVLSWSLLNAMACGCAIVASDTDPVREVLHDGENARLAGFFDPDGLAARGLEVLHDPEFARRSLGAAARRTIENGYAQKILLPQLHRFFTEVAATA